MYVNFTFYMFLCQRSVSFFFCVCQNVTLCSGSSLFCHFFVTKNYLARFLLYD